MATKLSAVLQMSNSTDALFRAWVQFIDDLILVTGGWTHTTDTGQMTIATATHPAAVNTKVGYRVYAMADTLQATAPVFVRIDFGSEDSSANNPTMWVTIGTGSDGAGNITGVVFNGGTSLSGTVRAPGTATSVCNSYGSAATNRVHALLFVRAAANDVMGFSLERSKDSTGADTADGLLFTYSGNRLGAGSVGPGFDTTQYIILAGGGQPPSELGVSIVLPNEATSAFSSNVAVGIPIHMKGIAQPVGLGVIAVNSGDFIAEASVSISLYGTAHNFQLGNTATQQVSIPVGNGAQALQRAATRVGIRYE